ncbi:hypothetical protein TorRG33x02_337740 [Trema orientale]|uniref:Uncharacterized protein n=1 Tax=Trema orientale TaxID=63057 RepID=A0A2P5AYG7_TREOI|nr:hypothetical protein TorRG33x02_337740 [Trema orientale]
MPEHGACQPAHPNHHSCTITYTRYSTTKRAHNPTDQEANKVYEHTEWHHARTARYEKAKAYNKSRDSPQRVLVHALALALCPHTAPSTTPTLRRYSTPHNPSFRTEHVEKISWHVD